MVEYSRTDDGSYTMPDEIRDMATRAGIPKRFLGANLHESSELGHIADDLRKYVTNWPQTHGVVFAGSTGFGKTHMACAVVNELLRIWSSGSDVNAFYFNMNATLPMALDMRLFKRYDSYASLMHQVTRADILIVDDLLHVPQVDFAKDVLYRIYEERYAAMLPTITTLNGTIESTDNGVLNWDPVSDTFNEPFMRRLVETAANNVFLV